MKGGEGNVKRSEKVATIKYRGYYNKLGNYKRASFLAILETACSKMYTIVKKKSYWAKSKQKHFLIFKENDFEQGFLCA